MPDIRPEFIKMLCRFEPLDIERLEAIRERYGLPSAMAAVRVAIREAASRIATEATPGPRRK